MLPNARGRGSDLLWRCCNTYTSIPVLWMSSYSSLYGGMSHIWKYLLPKIWDFLYSLTVVCCGRYSTLVSLNATVSRCLGWRRPLFKMVTNLPVHICSQREYSQTITDNVIIWIQLPAVLWHCWLGVRKSIRLYKLSDEVLLWLSARSEVQIVCIWSSWRHCFPKRHRLLPHLNPDWFYLSSIGLPRFLYVSCIAYPGCPGKKAVKRL